jgi:restriction endonuclease S subunit
MKYQTYPAYKDSGVEWLGDVPEHWDVWKLNHFSPIITCGVAATPDYIDDGVIFLSAQNVKNRSVDLSKGFKYISKEKHSELTKNRAPKNGDILLSRVGTVGEVCIVDVDFEFSIFVSLTHLRLNQKICTNRFFVFLCESTYTKSLHSAVTLVGGGVGNLNVNDLKEYRLPLPALSEQQKIAQFLDHETAKIDTLIEKQQRLIELLKEKRQAVISHAVTKGLNPNAPMKESGVEWLGNVPEGWEVKRLKFIVSAPLMYGANEAAIDTNVEHPRFVRITDVDVDGSLREDTFRSLNEELAKFFMLAEGDVLLARSGGTVGKSFIYANSWGRCCFAGYLIKASIRQNNVLAEWFYQFTQTQYYWEWIASNQIQATIQNVSADKYNNFFLTVPPMAEQQEIINNLETSTNRLNDLIFKAETAIELMQERRTALISAAVTGKIDVRHWGD